MPVIKSAIKKLRKDKKREKSNDVFNLSLEKIVKTAEKTHGKKEVSSAFSMIDKAVKRHIIHKNKAARMKSRLAKPVVKAVASPAQTQTPAKVTKKTPTKQAAKKASKKK